MPSCRSRLRLCSRRPKNCAKLPLCWPKTKMKARFWLKERNRVRARRPGWDQPRAVLPHLPSLHALRAGHSSGFSCRGLHRRQGPLMTFQSLLVCKDEPTTDVLTPVLAGFGLGVQCCGYPDALCRLTEQKFDAVIVDYDDPHSAALVLQNAYQSSTPHKTVTVALLSDKTKVRHVFGAGANFVLYKPISQQQAEASLRAAMALMKRERRRSFRVPVQLPVRLRVENGAEKIGRA